MKDSGIFKSDGGGGLLRPAGGGPHHPKPGLVDHTTAGAPGHVLPDLVDSTRAVVPYLVEMAETGWRHNGICRGVPRRSAPVGVKAEQAMFAATGGQHPQGA